MQFIPLPVRLKVALEDSPQTEATVLALMYDEADPGFPTTPSLSYLVSIPGEPRPRVIPQDQVVRQVAD